MGASVFCQQSLTPNKKLPSLKKKKAFWKLSAHLRKDQRGMLSAVGDKSKAEEKKGNGHLPIYRGADTGFFC